MTLEVDDTAQWVTLHEAGTRKRLFDARQLPATRSGRAAFNIQNALFASAVALALGQTPAAIAAALATFHGNAQDNMGRLNHCEGLPFDVVVDYCHNRHGIEALGRYARALDIKGRTLLSFALPGNRRDEDFILAAREAARHFDVFVAYPELEKYLRGRAEAECTALLRQGFRAERGDEQGLHVAEDWVAAAHLLLRMAAPGDCVFLTGFNPEQIHDAVRRFRSQYQADAVNA